MARFRIHDAEHDGKLAHFAGIATSPEKYFSALRFSACTIRTVRL